MKKASKLLSILLVLFMVMSIFAACGKDDNHVEESTTENFTLQINSDNDKYQEESTTKVEETAETEVTTKEEKTTKVRETTKVSGTTKAPATTKVNETTKVPGTTKAPATTKVNDKTEDKNTTAAPTTQPDITHKEETTDSNIDLLLGIWDTTFEAEGLPFSIQFEFKMSGKVVETDFTKTAYNNMIEKAIENEMLNLTNEDITEAGFTSREEYKEAFRTYLIQEVPYDELRNMFRSTGTWYLVGNTLTVTIDGETATSETKLLEGERSFVLKESSGESMTLTKR